MANEGYTKTGGVILPHYDGLIYGAAIGENGLFREIEPLVRQDLRNSIHITPIDIYGIYYGRFFKLGDTIEVTLPSSQEAVTKYVYLKGSTGDDSIDDFVLSFFDSATPPSSFNPDDYYKPYMTALWAFNRTIRHEENSFYPIPIVEYTANSSGILSVRSIAPILGQQVKESIVEEFDLTESMLAIGNFVPYNTDTNPTLRKQGNVINIFGMIKPYEEIAASQETDILRLDSIYELSGWRPSVDIVTICQGSGMNRWMLRLRTNGRLTAARYGTTTDSSYSPSTWMPFNMTYIA